MGSGGQGTSIFEPVDQAKNKVVEDTRQTASDVKDNVYTTIENSVSGLFGKQPQQSSQPIVEVVSSSNPLPQAPINIDLGKANDIKLTMPKNTKYYLHFSNTPPNYCIYINNDKFPIDDQKMYCCSSPVQALTLLKLIPVIWMIKILESW